MAAMPQLPPTTGSAVPPPSAAGGLPPSGPPGGGDPLSQLADKGGGSGSLLQLILTFLAGMGGGTLLEQLPKLMSKMSGGPKKGQPGQPAPQGGMPPGVTPQMLAQLAQRGGGA